MVPWFKTFQLANCETLAYCPDARITLLLLGKQVNELLENNLNSVSYQYFNVPCQYTGTSLTVGSQYIICKDLPLFIKRILSVCFVVYAVVPWFKNFRPYMVENIAKMTGLQNQNEQFHSVHC